MLTIGIDDAGRGPIIGPMILAGILVDKNSETALKKHPINDSKQLTHPTRISLSKIIKESSLAYKVVSTTPNQIDKSLTTGTNLNTLEAQKAAQIINELNTKKDKIKVIVDCPSVNTLSWKQAMISFIDHPDNLDIKCEHKADENHLSVAAASILAKVRREEEVEKIKKQHGNIGSGYPSDPYTKEFLKENGKKLSESGIFRKTWATWRNLFPQDDPNQKGQISLDKF